MDRRRTLVCLLLGLVLVGAACAKSNTAGGGSGKPEVAIAFMGALSGPNASLEIGPKNAAGLVIDQANAKGDFPVRLVYEPQDTQGVETQARTIAQKLRSDDRIAGLIGPGFSGESKSSGDILEDLGFARVTPSATATSLSQHGWAHWYRGVASDATQGGRAPDVIVKYLKAKKVYIAHDKTEYGQGIATIVRDGLKAMNPGLVVGFEGVDPGKDDYSPLVTKVVAQGADVFYWGGYEPEAVHLVAQLKQKGFTGTFLGADGAKGSTLVKVPEAEGVVLTCPCIEPNISPDAVAKTFVSDYKAKFKTPPSIYAAEGHDAALVLIDAIRKAGAPGNDMKAYRAKVNANVKATSGLQGVAGTYAFQSSGELAGNPAVLLYKIKGGTYEALGQVDDLTK
jgi:branched-chain amino acid transport system substrate-binding protein